MEASALDPYVERLRELPFVQRVEVERAEAARPLVDARLRITTRAGIVSRVVELKRTHLTREASDRLVGLQGRSDEKLVVFAPHVGREIAARFVAAQMDFVDRAGNCHLADGDRYYFHVEGRAPAARDVEARAPRSSAYRVLLALLIRPALVQAPVRTLAAAAGGVSPQTALSARQRFVQQGLLRESEPFWTPRGHRRAVDLFAMSFDTMLAATLTIGRYRAREREPVALENALRSKLDGLGRWAWGGGGACDRLTGYFRGNRTVVYLESEEAASPNVGARLGLVPDASGPVTLMRSPGPLAFESTVPETIHPLLAWCDLLREHDERASDAAADLFERLVIGPR